MAPPLPKAMSDEASWSAALELLDDGSGHGVADHGDADDPFSRATVSHTSTGSTARVLAGKTTVAPMVM